MNKLTISIRTYVNDVLVPRLTDLVAQAAQKEGVPISLKFVDTPKMVAHISQVENEHVIHISIGWLVRLGLALTVVERMWETIDNRPPILALNQNSVFDDYFYGIECGSKFNFSCVPDLAALFVDTFSEDELRKFVDSFEEQFRVRKGGGEGLLKFTLPIAIPTQALKRLIICAEFLVLHEIAHVLLAHSEFVKDTTFSILNEIPATRFFRKPYKKKAVEVDADSFAVLHMIREKLNTDQIIDLRSIFMEVLLPVFFVISILDIGRRTIHQYQGKFASHPLPDIRAVSLCHIVGYQLRDFGTDLLGVLLDCRDEAVKYCINSYQRLGIPVGAFYIMGNRLVTLDDQFTSELAVIGIMKEELFEIQNEYWNLEAKRNEKSPIWNFEPFGMTSIEIREAAQSTAIAIFENGNVINEGAVEEIMLGRLKEAKRRLGEGQGHLIVTHHSTDTLNSPFLKPDWWKEHDKEEFFSKETQIQYEKIMNNTMKLLFEYAEVKAVDK